MPFSTKRDDESYVVAIDGLNKIPSLPSTHW